MNKTYTYPVILDYSEEGFINIRYPLFPEVLSNCVEAGKNYISLAQDTIAMTLLDRYDCGKPFPDEDTAFEVEDGQKVVYINLWMPYFVKKTETKCVNKTVTIPTWLNNLAMERKIPFSAVLVDALRRELGYTVVSSKQEKN